MSDSDSSSLSEHSDKEIQKLAPIFVKAKKATKLVAPPPAVSPPRPKRPPSPPHEEVLADNPDIALIVMFRSRFNEAFPPKLPSFGPQDIERGVIDLSPDPQVEQLMCALLGLMLNRKKPIERGHHGRALEEAMLTHKTQWPKSWNGQNPFHGGNSFENMSPVERLNLLRTLVMWTLSSSEAIQTIIKEKYKQNRHNDDENQPLSIQPWGSDGDKRRYFLVQGLDDTSFRVYREGSRYTKNAHWWSVAGSIEEVKELAKKLEDVDGTHLARRLAMRMTNAIPTFEATEEKRRRREYRQIRRAAFSRPEPGFSLYEGRTRGKRMRYTYDDDDDMFLSDETTARRSTRQSGRNTPFESGPTYTASGRQVRAPKTGEYGESLLSGAATSADEVANGEGGYAAASGTEDSEQPVRGGRPRHESRPVADGVKNHGTRKHIDGYNDIDEMSDEADANSSGEEWNSDKNGSEDDQMLDADDEDDVASPEDAEDDDLDGYRSLIVRLKVPNHDRPNLDLAGETTDEMLLDAPTTSHESGTTSKPKQAETSMAELSTKGEFNDPGPRDSNLPTDSANLSEHPASSPHAPSAYPTPTSSSFLPAEQKPNFATAPATQPLFPVHSEATIATVSTFPTLEMTDAKRTAGL